MFKKLWVSVIIHSFYKYNRKKKSPLKYTFQSRHDNHMVATQAPGSRGMEKGHPRRWCELKWGQMMSRETKLMDVFVLFHFINDSCKSWQHFRNMCKALDTTGCGEHSVLSSSVWSILIGKNDCTGFEDIVCRGRETDVSHGIIYELIKKHV